MILTASQGSWPQVGELVVATVRRLESYGAYVTLDEYSSREGFLHISEISSTWVRNIRNYIREGEKVVLQVLRVDPARGQVDLSLRRVSRDEQRKKIEDWKKNRRAEMMIKTASSLLKVNESDLYGEVAPRLEERFGSVYAGFEESVKKGAEVLMEAGLSEEAARVLAEIARDKIVIKGVTIYGTFELTSMEPRGVEAIKKVLAEAKELGEGDEAEVNLYTLGAPKYRIEVTSRDYKRAESALEKIVEAVRASWSSHDGRFSFKRE